jgi:uncharacterized protein (UPF0332 family)
MSIVKAHLEKAVERLRVAEKLFRDGDYEDAVSRAYYAMYHAARAALSTGMFSLRYMKEWFQNLAENSC